MKSVFRREALEYHANPRVEGALLRLKIWPHRALGVVAAAVVAATVVSVVALRPVEGVASLSRNAAGQCVVQVHFPASTKVRQGEILRVSSGTGDETRLTVGAVRLESAALVVEAQLPTSSGCDTQLGHAQLEHPIHDWARRWRQ